MKTTFLENEELHALPVEENETSHESSHEVHDEETELAEEDENDQHENAAKEDEDDQHEIEASDNHDEPGEDDDLEPTGVDTHTEHEAE